MSTVGAHRIHPPALVDNVTRTGEVAGQPTAITMAARRRPGRGHREQGTPGGGRRVARSALHRPDCWSARRPNHRPGRARRTTVRLVATGITETTVLSPSCT